MIALNAEDLHLHENYMAQALAQARLAAAAGEVPVGAVVVWQGQVIARAHNRREQSGDPCGHAEILALREAAQQIGSWRFNDAALYVTLEPCPMCAGAIGLARLKRVVYGAYDPRMGCAGSVYALCSDPRLGCATQIIGGVCRQQCAELLSGFFRTRRAQSEKNPSHTASDAPASPT